MPEPGARSPKPIIILVRPQLGENIGAVARAMSNFGLSELRLVAPRDGWPNDKAKTMASGADKIIDNAKVYDTFEAATADIQVAYATTARPRDMEKRVVTPDVAMREISKQLGCGVVEMGSNGEKKKKTPHHYHSITPHPPRIALVFGPERTGLENEEIAWCDTIITIPTAENKSLNVAQSSVVVFYEWMKQSSGIGGQRSGPKSSVASDLRPLPPPAPKADWQGLFEQMENYLDEINYWRVASKKTIMWQNLQNMLLRGQYSPQEVRTLRGMLRTIWERKKKGN